MKYGIKTHLKINLIKPYEKMIIENERVSIKPFSDIAHTDPQILSDKPKYPSYDTWYRLIIIAKSRLNATIENSVKSVLLTDFFLFRFLNRH